MKSAEAKHIPSHSSSHTSRPFFQKNRESAFFSGRQADIQAQPFFTKQAAMPFVQTKLSVGRPGDKYEEEADAMADRVVQRLAVPEPLTQKEPAVQGKPISTTITPLVQPKCAECEKEEKLQKKEDEDTMQELPLELQMKPAFDNLGVPPVEEENIQRKCAECEKEEKLQAKADSSAEATAPPNIESSLNASKGGGSPLPAATKKKMEGSFGADFSNVRLHIGNAAIQMNKDLHAQAFTHGSDIYFNTGKYNPNNTAGNHLLAHELTHVMQQEKKDLKPAPSSGYIQKQGICEAPGYSEVLIYNEVQGVCEIPALYTPTVNEVNSFASKPFFTIAKVMPVLGIRLHTTPSDQDYDYQNKTGRASDYNVQPQGTYITIIGIGTHPHVGWVKIITNSGLTGWIEQRFLQPLIPLPANDEARKERTKPEADQLTKHLHYVEPGDTLEALINKYYKDYPYRTGNDRRTIAHAFFILNEKNPGVRLIGSYDDSFWKDTVLDRDFAETRKIYKTIQLFYGHWIRLPSIYYINLQRELGAVGVRPEWKNTTIAIGRGVQGFFEGVVEGFAQAGIDMVVDLWNLVKGIFTGELFKRGYQLVKQFIGLYQEEGIIGIWRVIAGFFKGIYNSFKDRWNTPNPRQRWKFVGEIVGMILFEVVLAILTAGAGTALKWSGRMTKVLKKFPALDNIVRSGTKQVQNLKGRMGKAVKTAKDLRNKKRLGFSDKGWDRFIANKNKSWHQVKRDPKLLKLEVEALKNSPPRMSTKLGYDIEIELPNGHIYRRKKDGSGWCRFSNDPPEGCGDIPVDDYIGWDPELEEKWNRQLLGEPKGKQAARDVKELTPKDERMTHLYRQLQKARAQYMGKNPSWNPRDQTVKAVIARMRKQKKVVGIEPYELVKVKGPNGKESWYPISKVDMGHVPDDAVEYWNNKGYKYGARSKEVRDWMKNPDNYELEHAEVNRARGAAIASKKQYRRPLR